MRKSVIGVLAAAGLAVAAPASAQDEMMGGVTITGFMNEDIGFGSWIGGDESKDDLHFQTNAEIHFTASGTTDGGLTVSATVEMDADSSGSVDESRLSIAGGFGKIILGSEDNAAALIGNVGIGNDYAGTGYYDGGENYTPSNGSPNPIPNSDGVGIRYITPVIGGFQAGVSWQPQAESSNDGGATTTTNDETVIAMGASFAQDFGSTSITVGGNYVSEDVPETTTITVVTTIPENGGPVPSVAESPVTIKEYTKKSWGIGTSIGFGDTTLNARYDTKGDTHVNPLDAFKFAVNASMGDKRESTVSYGLGIDHSIGALTFGIGYGAGTAERMYTKSITVPHADAAQATATPGLEEGDAMPGMATAKFVDGETTVISAGGKYDLGGGVTIHLAITSGSVNQVVGEAMISGKCTMPANTFVAEPPATVTGTGPGCFEPNDITDGELSSDSTADRVAGDLNSHTKTFTIKDIDDVGVGLRIALSF